MRQKILVMAFAVLLSLSDCIIAQDVDFSIGRPLAAAASAHQVDFLVGVCQPIDMPRDGFVVGRFAVKSDPVKSDPAKFGPMTENRPAVQCFVFYKSVPAVVIETQCGKNGCMQVRREVRHDASDKVLAELKSLPAGWKVGNSISDHFVLVPIDKQSKFDSEKIVGDSPLPLVVRMANGVESGRRVGGNSIELSKFYYSENKPEISSVNNGVRSWTYPGSIRQHLVSQHGLSASQVSAMTDSECIRIHNLDHEKREIISRRSGNFQQADTHL